jgi:hypothetical protein
MKDTWTLEELFEAKFPPRTWIVEGLIYPGVSTQFFGQGKIGKTHFMLDLALHVAYAEPDFLGLRIQKSGPVLYFMLEEEAQDLAPILHSHPLANPNFYSESMTGQFEIRMGLNLSNKEDWAILKESCSGRVLCVLDSLTSLRSRFNKSKPEDAKELVLGLNDIARETGCAFVFINHQRNPSFVEETLGDKASDDYRMRTQKGAGELFDLSGGTFKLEVGKNNPRLLIQPRHASAQVIHLKKVFLNNEPWWRITEPGSGSKNRKRKAPKMESFDEISVEMPI